MDVSAQLTCLPERDAVMTGPGMYLGKWYSPRVWWTQGLEHCTSKESISLGFCLSLMKGYLFLNGFWQVINGLFLCVYSISEKILLSKINFFF